MGDDDWNVLGGIDRVIELGHRVLVGASRKRFIGHLVGENQAHRDLSTAVISGFLAEHGVWAARVHNVDASSVVLATLEKIQQHSKKTQ